MENKIKIAMLSDHPDTQNPRIWRTAVTMAELGYEVTLFCLRQAHENVYEYKENVHIRRAFTFKLGTSVLVDKYLTAHFQLKELLCKKEYDVFHCHDPETWPIGYLMAKEQNSKWIADSHEFFLDYIERKYYGDDLNKYKSAVLLGKNRGYYFSKADGVITVSEDILRELFTHYKLELPHAVIYNTRKDIIDVDKHALRIELKISLNKRYLVFAGNITPERGLETIIKMMKYMPTHYKLIIIGEGLSNTEVNLINEIPTKVLNLGKIPYYSLIQYIYACDGYLYFPNRKEIDGLKNYQYTIPNKLFDAIFSKIPFFTYEGYSFSNIVEKFNIGMTYEVDKSIDKIAQDIVEKIETGYFKSDSFNKAINYFSWDNQKEKLKKVYEDIFQ